MMTYFDYNQETRDTADVNLPEDQQGKCTDIIYRYMDVAENVANGLRMRPAYDNQEIRYLLCAMVINLGSVFGISMTDGEAKKVIDIIVEQMKKEPLYIPAFVMDWKMRLYMSIFTRQFSLKKRENSELVRNFFKIMGWRTAHLLNAKTSNIIMSQT